MFSVPCPRRRVRRNQQARPPAPKKETAAARPAGRSSAPARPPAPKPWSQSFSQSYGSNLPTSLTYVLVSTRGSSPWRPAAVISTSGRESCPHAPGFSRTVEHTPDASTQPALFPRPAPSLRITRFHGMHSVVKQKRKLFLGYSPASPGLLALPLSAPHPGDGILAVLPFPNTGGRKKKRPDH